MERRDYILRVIEQFGQFAIALRTLLSGGHAGSVEVKQTLRSAARHAGLDLDLARLVAPEALLHVLAPSGEIEPGRCWMCAETLYLDGLEAELCGDADRARASYGKARMLFSLIAPSGAFLVGFPEARERTDEIDRKLAGLDGPDGPGSTSAHPRRVRPAPTTRLARFERASAVVVLTTLAAAASPASARQAVETADGTIVQTDRCAFGGFDAQPANLRRFYTEEEYEQVRAAADVDCRRIRYMSDGLQVVGYAVAPRTEPGERFPVVIYNRGGFGDVGRLTDLDLMDFYPIARNGFVVLASQYRGNDGGEGRDEVGGADVNDVVHLVAVARDLEHADPGTVFMYGHSRGGIMTFLALRRGMAIRAVAVIGAVFDAAALAERLPDAFAAVTRMMPDYEERGDEVLRERSVLNWADELDAPILILHGARDNQVPAEEALAFARLLEARRAPYGLFVYPYDNHAVLLNRADRNERIVEWFRRHLEGRGRP